MKILIIDDEKEIIEIFKDKLGKSGHQILSSSDGEEGMKLAQKEKPDLILLDIIMPKINGLDVLKGIKENKETKKISVFILTNLPPEVGEAEAKKLGAERYLFKAENEPAAIMEMIEQLNQNIK